MIDRLKRSYQEYRKKLGDTGHGLVASDREAEIIVGSPIYNVFGKSFSIFLALYTHDCCLEKMQKRFKWYKRLHALLSVNPVYDRTTLVNSATPLSASPPTALTLTVPEINDLEMATPAANSDRYSPDWDHEMLNKSFDDDANMDRMSSLSHDDDITDPAVPAPLSPVALPPLTPIKPPVSSTHTTAKPVDAPQTVPQKRKNPYEHFQEVNERSQKARVDVAAIKATSKQERYTARQQTLLAIEKLKVDSQSSRDEKQQAHELKLLDKQIELARLQALAAGVKLPIL